LHMCARACRPLGLMCGRALRREAGREDPTPKHTKLLRKIKAVK